MIRNHPLDFLKSQNNVEALPLLGVIGVCPAESGWRVVWHQNSFPDQPNAMVVFKVLESPKFDGCLRRLIESDERVHALVSRLRPDMDLVDASEVLSAVHNLWRAFGVERAIEEVANTGRTGEQVSKVFRACESIKPGTVEIKSLD